MKKVSGPQVVTPAEASEMPRPAVFGRLSVSWSARRGRDCSR